MSPIENQSPQGIQAHLAEVKHLLSRQKLVADMVHRQDLPKQELVDSLVHSCCLIENLFCYCFFDDSIYLNI